MTTEELKVVELMQLIEEKFNNGDITKETVIKYVGLLEDLAYECFPKDIEPDGNVTYCCATIVQPLL